MKEVTTEKKSRNANSDTKNVEPRPKCEFDEREHKNTDITDVPISDISFLVIEKNKEKRTKPKCESDAREQMDICNTFFNSESLRLLPRENR